MIYKARPSLTMCPPCYRFYLEPKKDPHGPEVTLFVGNLPPNLAHKQYETLLMDYLDEGKRRFLKIFEVLLDNINKYLITGCKFTQMEPIYYEYGSMVITFDNSEAAVQAYEILKESYYEDKLLSGKNF